MSEEEVANVGALDASQVSMEHPLTPQITLGDGVSMSNVDGMNM